MSNYYIGRSGRFNVASPFETLVKARVVYTVKSHTFLSEHARDGIDVYSAIYKIAGMTKEEYETDMSDDVKILTLVDSSGNTIYIPEHKVIGGCIRDGVEYASKTLLLNLGGLPNSLSLTDVLSDVAETISSRIGVVPVGEVVTTSITEIISNQEHTALTTARTVSVEDNNLTRLNTALERIASLEETILDLECIIKEKVVI